jgi:sigma-E factor negative regulatory protein RseC
MVEEQAIIVSTHQNQAALEILRNKPCGLCGQTRGCGLSFWGKLFAHRANTFKAKNHIEAKVGDVVIVGVEESALLFSAVAVYGIPLLFLLIGAFSGNALGYGLHADRNTAIGAVLGLLLGYIWVKGHAQGRSLDARYSPVILRMAKVGSSLNIVSECKSVNK